ncbi:putative DNA-binding transcriptional regulator YafY [Kribbella sp. VKM Ac-2527]|uniref:Putative DNA-binding transcriptional regulator YafY n=1 Tax=Kribbella caucasensis TaxID=2512215 RepID=A0A4R6J3G6_9ACTN|nr:WYL domain-containing protein [Kribbella sp. VKM Ac-2527]TDO29863.1 putative DNA-binding transcriptional regulator YafY [Kribbella sp. VKM Ac-2527]
MLDTDPSRGRAGRLEALKLLLVERDHTTITELAHELGVSVRTVHRDLSFLRDLGMPVDSDRGRGGGLRLEHGWSLGRVHLSETEAIGLLLSLTIAERIGSPLLLDDTRSIARKIAASFAPAQGRRILAIRRRILVGSRASDRALSSYTPPSGKVAKPLLDAFANRRVAVVSYQDQHARLTEREIELQYLYYNVPIWYALAWDRLRDDIRSFRIDRIKTFRLLPETFPLRRNERFLAAGEPDARAL